MGGKHDVGDTVFVDGSVSGEILEIDVNSDGETRYRVEYMNEDGDAKVAWFGNEELRD